LEKIQDWFPDVNIVKSSNAHMINPALETKNLSLKSEDNDLDLLTSVIKPNEQTIIFCDKKTKIEKVCEHL
jgi:superfamily II DNA/RNA helicase